MFQHRKIKHTVYTPRGEEAAVSAVSALTNIPITHNKNILSQFFLMDGQGNWIFSSSALKMEVVGKQLTMFLVHENHRFTLFITAIAYTATF